MNKATDAAGLPHDCTKAEFARLLGVGAANVSRWAGAGRLDLDKHGRVVVVTSLTKLLATADPSRGGLRGNAGVSGSGSVDTIRRLLAEDAAQRDPSRQVSSLKAQVAELTRQLAAEVAFRKERHLSADDLAAKLCAFAEQIDAAWGQLSDCRKADGDAFERLWDRIEGRVFYGWSDAEADEHIRQTYEGEP